jgi:inorganic pyrophosphatase
MKVFIQKEAGSFTKNFHDEKTLTFVRTTRVSRAYPLPYGFILNTTGDDGLNVDCFVLLFLRKPHYTRDKSSSVIPWADGADREWQRVS